MQIAKVNNFHNSDRTKWFEYFYKNILNFAGKSCIITSMTITDKSIFQRYIKHTFSARCIEDIVIPRCISYISELNAPQSQISCLRPINTRRPFPSLRWEKGRAVWFSDQTQHHLLSNINNTCEQLSCIDCTKQMNKLHKGWQSSYLNEKLQIMLSKTDEWMIKDLVFEISS